MCVSDPKPKKRSSVNLFTVIVVIYLILLTVGTGLLVMQGKAFLVPCGLLWVPITQDLKSRECWGHRCPLARR